MIMAYSLVQVKAFNTVIRMYNHFFTKIKHAAKNPSNEKLNLILTNISSNTKLECKAAIDMLGKLVPEMKSPAMQGVYNNLISNLNNEFMDILNNLPETESNDLMDVLYAVENIIERFEYSVKEVQKAEEVLSEYICDKVWEFRCEKTNRVTETIDEIMDFLHEKASHVSFTEWKEIKYEVFNRI